MLGQVSYATAALLSKYKDVFDYVFVVPYTKLSGSSTNAQFVSGSSNVRRRSGSNSNEESISLADEDNAKLRGYIVSNMYNNGEYSALPFIHEMLHAFGVHFSSGNPGSSTSGFVPNSNLVSTASHWGYTSMPDIR